MMRILLDTHALLWMLDDDRRLGEHARRLVADRANDIFVSMVSIWEAALKVRMRKLEADVQEIVDVLAPSGIRTLGLLPPHLVQLVALTKIVDHKDPFDRMLIAQAIAEDLHFMSADRHVTQYPVKHLRCAEGS